MTIYSIFSLINIFNNASNFAKINDKIKYLAPKNGNVIIFLLLFDNHFLFFYHGEGLLFTCLFTSKQN